MKTEKVMTKEQLEVKQEEINKRCLKIARANGLISETVAGPLYDGVADEAMYLRSNPKVLWILQEPHDNNEKRCRKGNWSVPKKVILEEDYGFGNSTHEAIAKVMFSFRNDESYASVNEKYRSNDAFSWTVMGALKDIAWINVSKMPCPNGTKSDANRIKKAYQAFWRDIVIEQVQQVYKPDIVLIAGDPWNYVADEIAEGPLRQLPGYEDQVDHWIDDAERQFLWVDHPAARKTKCFDIWVKALKDCDKYLRKNKKLSEPSHNP